MNDDEASHAYLIWYRDLRQCGCGNPEEAWALVQELLAACPLYEDAARPVLDKYPNGALQFIVNVLDDAELMEHGGSWRGSWLTEKGQWLLDQINAAGGAVPFEEALDMQGYPHGGDPCPPDCEIAKRW